jgi:hypothetical protein
MIEVLPPLRKYKYNTWRILLVKCYIDNSVHLRSCIINVNTYLLNLLPTKGISAPWPNFTLFGTNPSYAHIRVFGCACYLNTSVIAPRKLTPHSCRCVFLSYSSEHKGYRCLDLTINHLLVSRHVIFDESSLLVASSDTNLSTTWTPSSPIF